MPFTITDLLLVLLGSLVRLFPPLSELPLPGSVPPDLLLDAQYGRLALRLSHLSQETAGRKSLSHFPGNYCQSALHCQHQYRQTGCYCPVTPSMQPDTV